MKPSRIRLEFRSRYRRHGNSGEIEKPSHRPRQHEFRPIRHDSGAGGRRYSRTRCRRRALPITETEERLMAAAAMMGVRRTPNTG